jgi:hypothetical protein
VSTSYNQIITRVANQVIECEREDNVEDEMTNIMQQNSGQGNDEVLKTLIQFLADRYDTKYWFVIVYDALSGYNNHCVSGFFHSVFRQGNKNAVATSFPAGQEYRFEQYQWDFLNNFPCDSYYDAETAWNDITEHVPNAGMVAIKRDSQIAIQYPKQVDVHRKDCKDFSLITFKISSASIDKGHNSVTGTVFPSLSLIVFHFISPLFCLWLW